MNTKQLFERLVKERRMDFALALNANYMITETEKTLDVVEKMIKDLNACVKNMTEALDEWRCENEYQFDEDSDYFNDWIGDTLAVQEFMEDSQLLLEDLKQWGLI